MDGPEGIGLNQGYSPFLTSIALGYIPQESDYVARQLFPNVPVLASTGQYNILRRGNFLRSDSKQLDNFEAAPIKGFVYDKSSYTTAKYGIATMYTDIDLANAGVAGIGAQNHINNKVFLVTLDPIITLELQTANLVRNASSWNTVLQGVASNPVLGTSFLQWDNPASTPIEDVQYVRQIFKLLSGQKANNMLLPDAVWQKLQNNPEMINRIRYQASQGPDSPLQVTLQTVAALFGFDNILVPSGVYNTAKEGQPDNIVPIWGRDVLIYFAPNSPSIEQPSAGYFFSWTGGEYRPQTLQGTPNAQGLFIRRYWQDRPAGYFIESEWFTTPKVTGPDLGILMQNAIAASTVAP